jgi:hypothetical protein
VRHFKKHNDRAQMESERRNVNAGNLRLHQQTMKIRRMHLLLFPCGKSGVERRRATGRAMGRPKFLHG